MKWFSGRYWDWTKFNWSMTAGATITTANFPTAFDHTSRRNRIPLHGEVGSSSHDLFIFLRLCRMICINTWLHKGSQTELVGFFLLSCRYPGTLVSHRINGQKRLVHTSCLSHSHGVETLKPPMINIPIRFNEMSIYSGHDCLINHEAKHFMEITSHQLLV